MTDNTSTVAGNYTDAGLQEITVILDEGAITTGESYDETGRIIDTYSYASGLKEGDWVALSNDVAGTFVATGGKPIVEKAITTESLVMFQLTGTPEPAEKNPATDAAADTLAERLAGKFYRICRAKVWGGIQGVQKATIMCDGTNATVPGVGSTLKFNITSGYSAHTLQFDQAASAGVGVVPLNYVPAGTDGDTYSCLVGITAAFYAITGA